MNNIFPSEIVLKRGSHELPSDGSCAMEVAVLASGFSWSKIRCAHDLPPCFSRVIGGYTIGLNDSMYNEERQKLLKYVTRMGGSADTPVVELNRLEYLVMNAAKPAAVSALMVSGLLREAERADATNTIAEFSTVALDCYRRGYNSLIGYDYIDYVLFNAGKSVDEHDIALRANYIAATIDYASYVAEIKLNKFDWQPYLDALEGALNIGKQADPIEVKNIERAVKVLVA